MARSLRDPGVVSGELDAARAERIQFVRESGGRFREDDHDQVDTSIAEAVAKLQATLDAAAAAGRYPVETAPGMGPSLTSLAPLWAATRPEFAKDLHAAVDRNPPSMYAPVPRAAFQKRLGALNKRTDELERELEVIRAAGVVEERRADLTAAEAELATVEGGTP